jgi:menaquinone-9 beta-reductase
MSEAVSAFDVAIAGAGPAGTSAAIHLAAQGARVLLIEQKKFPRAKLCGEFISPECLSHFERLGVAHEMNACGGASITKTVFYTRKGRAVAVPSNWFSQDGAALGLSRAEMDARLLDRAKNLGVFVLENAHASALILEGERVSGLRVNVNEEHQNYRALVTLDATGRSRVLSR